MSEEVDFDVIVIGGGAAGAICAYTLAEQERGVLLVEYTVKPGSENLSGGVFYCCIMEKAFPNLTDVAPVERRITQGYVSLINASSFVNIDYWDQRLSEPVNAVIVPHAKLGVRLLEQCEEAGVTVMPGMKVDSLTVESKKAADVRAGEDGLRSHVVVAADGVSSFITQQAGIRAKEPMEHLAVDVKSVIGLPRKVFEGRFDVRGKEGVTYVMVGDCTQGVVGGGFLYTNEESTSVRVVIRLDDLEKSGLPSSDVHDYMLRHPTIAPLLEDGILLEYGCHLTVKDGPAMASHGLTCPGLVIIGNATGFTLNTGLTIRGMNLAAGFALMAAETIRKAFQTIDSSQGTMDAYRGLLDSGFVDEGMATYAKTPTFLKRPRIYKDYEKLAAEVFYGIFNHDLKPRYHMRKVGIDVLKAPGLKLTQIMGDVLAGIRAL